MQHLQPVLASVKHTVYQAN